ncbi:acyltransferase family protein [Polaribacter litorisediminis]|uniref:acyltransferase family protein n=1 Tax=Polaribacter litorisediminis TaxID=1908341 RepID=UPI001CBC147F|nr:acyltransferase family protein [Polaribacter litorisediminis]UAM98692.1 acyltransferase family protein [Polaribacter litorisediminis]
MKVQPSKTERIHALDSLRAIMMILGIVLHSALNYVTWDNTDGWGLKDVNAMHASNDFIFSFIHTYRMQLFFVIAGFFGSMLFYERAPLKMIKNRVARLLLPFLVFVMLLRPILVFCWTYSKSTFAGNEAPLADALAKFSSFSTFIPERTFHLWFLYHLIIITCVSVALGFLFKKLPTISAMISKAFSWVIQKPVLRILIFSCMTFAVLTIRGDAKTNQSDFLPDLNIFFFYFTFYMVGWVLFKSKHLLDSLMKLDWATTIFGFGLYCLYFFVYYEDPEIVEKVLLKAFMAWAFIFGITGLFIRYGSQHSSLMRYISDSSYWVYLIHLGLTAFIPALIADWALPSPVKFIIVTVSTGIICFSSYHYLVRGTFIGRFLNGRRYSRKLSDIKNPVELSTLKPIASN